MKYLVKDTPIRKNKKTYGVGEAFPYSDKDKKLLWNLTIVENVSETKVEAKKKTQTVAERSRSKK